MKIIITALASLFSVCSFAQSEQDPVLMTISGEPVTRSEFEYSYNKNNSDEVIDKKNLDEYVDLFINYKLKVRAAEDAKIDTLSSFKEEFATYRDQQVRPTIITDADVEKEAYSIYKETQEKIDNSGGMVKPAHILIMVKQDATDNEVQKAKAKADSIYNVLKQANFDKDTFAQLVSDFSDDKRFLSDGGEMPWIGSGMSFPEYDEKVFSMTVGETSEPVKSSQGYYIIQLRDKGPFFSYESQRDDIMKYIERRGIKDKIINEKLDSIAKAQGNGMTPEIIIAQKREQMEDEDPNLKFLIQEYHDGLMLYEISNQKIWDYAEKDTKGLEQYFKKNKKKYKWDTPRFKGIAYRTKDVADIENVKEAIKNVKFEDWNEVLRSTFNNDSVLKIRAEKGIFRPGDNAIVDKYIFKTDAEIKDIDGYPFVGVYGRTLKQPESYADVRGLVVADYQEELEKEWVAELRKKYPVTIDKIVLATVNNH